MVNIKRFVASWFDTPHLFFILSTLRKRTSPTWSFAFGTELLSTAMVGIAGDFTGPITGGVDLSGTVLVYLSYREGGVVGYLFREK